MTAVSVSHIDKTYGKVHALKDLSFTVDEGELYGIIGPDGAGKTTLFRILATPMRADKGTAEVAGCDVVKDYRKIRNIIGYMPGRFSLYQDLTVEENLKFFATVFNTTIQENYHLIEDIYKQIEPFKHRKAGKLSGGMKQKLAVTAALLHAPKLLLLDEPFVGLDPEAAFKLKEVYREMCAEGAAIFFSTHVLDVAEKLCGRIAIIKDGRLVADGATDEVRGDESLEQVFLEVLATPPTGGCGGARSARRFCSASSASSSSRSLRRCASCSRGRRWARTFPPSCSRSPPSPSFCTRSCAAAESCSPCATTTSS